MVVTIQKLNMSLCRRRFKGQNKILPFLSALLILSLPSASAGQAVPESDTVASDIAAAFVSGCLASAPTFDGFDERIEDEGFKNVQNQIWVNSAETVFAAITPDGTCATFGTTGSDALNEAVGKSVGKLSPVGRVSMPSTGENFVLEINGATVRARVQDVREGFAGVLLAASDSPAVTSNPPAGPSAVDTGTGLAPDARRISVNRARELFDLICGASLPDFDDAGERLARNNFTRKSPTGSATLYSQTENVSFQIQNGPGTGRTCSMAFASDASAAEVSRAMMTGKITDFAGQRAALFGESRALVLEGPVRLSAGLSYFGYKLLSER